MKQQQKSLDMGTKLLDYVKVYDKLVPDDFCQSILETFGESDHQYIDREQRPSFTQLELHPCHIRLWATPLQISVLIHIVFSLFFLRIRVYFNFSNFTTCHGFIAFYWCYFIIFLSFVKSLFL